MTNYIPDIIATIETTAFYYISVKKPSCYDNTG